MTTMTSKRCNRTNNKKYYEKKNKHFFRTHCANAMQKWETFYCKLNILNFNGSDKANNNYFISAVDKFHSHSL